MDLLDTLRGALKLLRGGNTEVEPWAENVEAFETHFHVQYEDFASRLVDLDKAHAELYEKTARVNPEAAVTWVFFITEIE